MATQSSLQDCYFYFYSSCTKGDECPFRHCELALGTETVCSLWREGRCFRSNCKFRHMESRINRTAIPCYWENQPGGCRKPHCVFLHRKLKNGVQDGKDAPGLILPTSDGRTSPKHLDSNNTCTPPNKAALAEKEDESDVPPDPSLTPVPPLVLSFDEGEESDTESVSSTPVKQGDKKAEKTRNNLSMRASGGSEEKDFGIKTLEQIRMEKIHKESDSYYGAAYASTPLDASRLMDQHYPPTTEFLALPKDSLLDKSSPAPIVEPKLSGVDEETDLRGRLSNRRNAPSNKVNQAKRLISFKKQNGNQAEVVSKLDFRIKTLDEIRREKESKQSQPEVVADSSSDTLPPFEEKKLQNNTKVKTFRKLKINRKSNAVSPVLKQDVTAINLTENTPADVTLDVTKDLSTKSSEKSSEVPVLNKNSLPGKRKSSDDSYSTSSKVIKFATVSGDGYEQINRVNASSDKAGENHLQRPEVQSSPPASNASSHVHSPTSSTSVPDTEMNGVAASLSPGHVSSSQSAFPSRDETLNTSVITNNSTSAAKDSLIDRSMSVDAELEELLGDDDMTIDEMDSAPNEDILLQIEEFLES